MHNNIKLIEIMNCANLNFSDFNFYSINLKSLEGQAQNIKISGNFGTF